jgi:hypothetical protein
VADVSDSGLAVLDDWIARMNALGAKDVGARVAARAAPAIEAEVKRTAAAGTTPDGAAWKPKVDGGRPLQNAAAHIHARALGNLIVVTLEGPTVWHHRGVRGNAPRQVIPDIGQVPPGIAKALTTVAREVFQEITEG